MNSMKPLAAMSIIQHTELMKHMELNEHHSNP